MKHTPVPEIIKDEIDSAINIPGLQHITTALLTHGNENTVDNQGRIYFQINNQPCGVELVINADGSYVLIAPDVPRAVSWTAEQGPPDIVKAAVIDALRAVVRAAA